MLIEFTHLNKYGNPRTRIFHRENSSFSHKKGFGKHVMVRIFKYKHEHKYLPPTLINLGGKKILSGYGEVHPKTTLNDIDWIKPKKINMEKITHEFKSKSSNVLYKTIEIKYPDRTEYTCNCRGYFMKRNKNEGCTHIQQLKKR